MRVVFDDDDREFVSETFSWNFGREPSKQEVDTLLGLVEMAITGNCLEEETNYFIENNIDDDGNFIVTTEEDK